MLTGDKVGLRPMESEDAIHTFKWFNDQRVLENLGSEDLYFCVTLEEEKLVVERMLRDLSQQWFIIVDLDTRRPIGLIGLANGDDRNASAEVRIVIGEVEEWGRGMGEDALRTLLTYAFDSRNLHRVWLRVAEYHERAIRLYRGCGFVEEGRYRHDHYHKGQWRDAYRMSLLDEEWRSR